MASKRKETNKRLFDNVEAMVKDSYTSGRQAGGAGGWSDNLPQDHEDVGEEPYPLFGRLFFDKHDATPPSA